MHRKHFCEAHACDAKCTARMLDHLPAESHARIRKTSQTSCRNILAKLLRGSSDIAWSFASHKPQTGYPAFASAKYESFMTLSCG